MLSTERAGELVDNERVHGLFANTKLLNERNEEGLMDVCGGMAEWAKFVAPRTRLRLSLSAGSMDSTSG